MARDDLRNALCGEDQRRKKENMSISMDTKIADIILFNLHFQIQYQAIYFADIAGYFSQFFLEWGS